MMMTIKENIEIIPELEEFIAPLKEDEFRQLEDNILKEGLRDPLIVWKKEKSMILIDGHNRYRICKKHRIPYQTKQVSFSDMDEVKEWIINNQLGRRNLNPDQMSYYRGLKYIGEKKKKGGNEAVLRKGKSEITTGERLAKEFNISPSTVKRDAKYAQGINYVGKLNPVLKHKILSGHARVKKSDLMLLADAENFRFRKIKDEKDIRNKASIIKETYLKDLEETIDQKKYENLLTAQKELQSRDEMFPSQEIRLKQIKGNIISLINRAIENKDYRAIVEMRDLVEKLEYILFNKY